MLYQTGMRQDYSAPPAWKLLERGGVLEVRKGLKRKQGPTQAKGRIVFAFLLGASVQDYQRHYN